MAPVATGYVLLYQEHQHGMPVAAVAEVKPQQRGRDLAD
jgi:hypothetical protein